MRIPTRLGGGGDDRGQGGAKAFLMFHLDLGSLYQLRNKYILQSFAYQEALIKSFSFTILVKTADRGDLSRCLKFG